MENKELKEIYWTTETIKEEWSKQKIRVDVDRESIGRKFRRILENKLGLSKKEIGWFKVTQKGNQKYFVFNKKVDVPKLMHELFIIFDSSQTKELVSVENEEKIKTILTEILPNPYEETKYSPKEEIQKCLDFLDKMKEFNIFKETEFSVVSEMIEEMQNLMHRIKREVKEEKKDSVCMKEYGIIEEKVRKISIIYKKVDEFFLVANPKYYFDKILRERVNEVENIQEYWEQVCRWSEKWLKVIERVKCIREAEKFYNIFELFEVNKKFQIIKIDEQEQSKYLEKLSLNSNEELKEYEQLFVRIGIDKICSDIIEEFEQKKRDKEENEIETVNNREKCIKKCIDKMEEIQSGILGKLTKSDRDRIKEMALDELIRMGETGDKNTQELQMENDMEQKQQAEEKEQKTLADAINDIRNMNRVQYENMIGKYKYQKRKEREESELQKDLEYVYAIKQAEDETILKYLQYRNFINI